MSIPSPQLSIIVPVLNEAEMLGARVQSFVRLSRGAELIFADGGSDDGSLSLLRDHRLRVVSCPPGRARQMNCGARHSSGSCLLFLHADTQIKTNISALIDEIHASDWGFFRVALSKQSWTFSILAKAINFRSRLFNIATGDQGIFVRRELFDEVGGFPDIELMEDIAMTRILRRCSPPKILAEPVVTSSRRWEERGFCRTVALMWFLQLAYKVGVAPKTLRKWYK